MTRTDFTIIANNLQKECHETVNIWWESLSEEKKKTAEYQDGVNAWMFCKLAQIINHQSETINISKILN